MSMFFQQKPSAISQNLLTESWNFLFFRCYKFSALISTDYFLRSWFCNWRCLFWDSQQHSLMQTTLNLTVTLKCSLFHVNFGYLKLKNNLIFFWGWFFLILCYHTRHLQQIHWNKILCMMLSVATWIHLKDIDKIS